MLLCSLVIATSGLSAVLIINDSAKQSYSSQETLLIPEAPFQVVPKTHQDRLTKADYVALRKQGFDQLIAIVQTRQHLFHGNTQASDRLIDFTGIDTLSLVPILNRNSQSKTQSQNSANKGLFRLSFNQPTGLIHPTLLEALAKNVETNTEEAPLTFTIQLDDQSYSSLPQLHPYKSASLGNDIVMDIGEFYRLFPNQNLTALFWVIASDSIQLQAQTDLLKAALPAHLVLSEITNNQQQGELTKSFHLNLLAMALLMFVVCLFIVLNAVNLLLNARKPWLKICRQLGISRQMIFNTQMLEIAFLTLVSTLLGMFLGLHLANLVSPSVQATLEGLYKVEVGFGSVSLFSLFVQVFGISLVGSITAVLIPLKSTERSLTNNSPDKKASSTNKLLWMLGILFTLIFVSILTSSQPLWLLLFATACLMLAGCCILLASYPKMLFIVTSLIPWSMPLLRTSSKQSLALSSKTKIACCAFFIAATSNIGMNLMVDSFRGATLTWLETRLASDYYLYYSGEEDIEALAELSDITLHPRFENRVSFRNLDIQQYSYPATEKFKQAMVFYQVNDLDTAWKAFEDNYGIFVNQQFAFHFNLALDDQITLPHPSTGIDTEYQIKGLIYDFGSPNKRAVLPISQFSAEVSTTSTYAIEASEQEIQRFIEQLTEVGIDYKNALLATNELLTLSMDTFDRTFIITDGLNIVTLLVAALSLACAIIVLMDDVQPQNMLIRSMGVSAIKTQALALFQYMQLCVLALLFATPFGILLSWVLIYEINYQAFQWTYPLQINPFKILQIYGLSLFVVLTVIAIPVIRAGRKPLIEDIRWLN